MCYQFIINLLVPMILPFLKKDFQIAETIVSILVPLFPILLYIFKRYSENKNTIIQLENLNNKSEML